MPHLSLNLIVISIVTHKTTAIPEVKNVIDEIYCNIRTCTSNTFYFHYGYINIYWKFSLRNGRFLYIDGGIHFWNYGIFYNHLKKYVEHIKMY